MFLNVQDLWDSLPAGYDPCTEGYAENYFNRKDVQLALHANVTNLPYPYSPCRLVLVTLRIVLAMTRDSIHLTLNVMSYYN